MIQREQKWLLAIHSLIVARALASENLNNLSAGLTDEQS
jgi:hypothetical protein